MKFGIWVLLFLNPCHPTVAGETEKAAANTVKCVLREDLAAIVLAGPLTELDLLVNGDSLFLPPTPSAGLSQAEKARNLFRFAGAYFMPWDAQLDVGLRQLFYGYGFGFCGEHARFLANLWRHAGIETRVVSLPNHVMVEAFVDEQWRLFDPQHRVDFSALFGKPMSFEDVIAAQLPDGIDSVGYRWAYLQEIYRLAKPKYTRASDFIAAPLLSIGPGQTITIRPRDSGEYYPLPIVYKRRPDYQTNLLNFYLLEIEHQFSETNPLARFPKMLPVLAATWFEGEPTEIQVDGEAQSAQELNQTLRAKTAEVTVAMPPGARFRITYALAGWMGGRLFAAGPRAVLEVAAKEQPSRPLTRYRTPPKLALSPIRIEEDALSAGRHRVQMDLSWSELPFQEPQDFEIVLDEQETGMLMEYLEHVGKFPFHWDPATHPRSGKVTITFEWTPKLEKSNRVPYENRLLLAHLIGPGLVAGRYYQTATFRDKARR